MGLIYRVAIGARLAHALTPPSQDNWREDDSRGGFSLGADGLLVEKKRAVREFNLYARILLAEGTVFQPVYVGIYTEITLSKLISAAL